MKLTICPITQRDAFMFVKRYHRHSSVPRGGVFCVCVVDEEGEVRGVGIAGRPAARALQDGLTCEITRVCTDGAFNACSMLYGALLRAAKALGYRRVYTYTLASEPGSSPRAAGFTLDAELPARGRWDCASRPRPNDPSPAQAKKRWVKDLGY